MARGFVTAFLDADGAAEVLLPAAATRALHLTPTLMLDPVVSATGTVCPATLMPCSVSSAGNSATCTLVWTAPHSRAAFETTSSGSCCSQHWPDAADEQCLVQCAVEPVRLPCDIPQPAAPQLLAVLRDGHRDVALQAFELTQALVEQHPAARGALLQAGVVKVSNALTTVRPPWMYVLLLPAWLVWQYAGCCSKCNVALGAACRAGNPES